MTDLDILIRLESKVDGLNDRVGGLNERMDRHENKNDARFKEVFRKLDSAADKVHQVELAGAREDGEIKIKMANMSGELKSKIAALSGSVALLITTIFEAAKAYFHK